MKARIIFLGLLILLSSFASAEISDLSKLLGYYSFDADAGDDHTTNRDGSVSGATHFGSGGLLSGYYSFDGNDYIDLNGYYNGVFDVFTISMWVNYTGTGAMNFWSGGNNYGPVIEQFATPSVNLRFQYNVQTGNGEVDTTQGPANSGTWRHIVFVYNGTHKAGWIDGKLNASTPSTGVGKYAATDTEIGKRPSSGWYFIGQMDEVGFWNRSLTPDEILALYNDGEGLAYPFGSGGDTDPPSISNLNCTSCIEDSTPNQPPYITEDTTPTFKFNTSESASCVIGRNDQNYTTMNATMSSTCSGDGTGWHTCTLPVANRFTSPGQHSDLYISCIDTSGNENTTSTSGSLVVEIKGASETPGDNAIQIGIDTSKIKDIAIKYPKQRLSARNLANIQFTGIFDWFVANQNNSRKWAFNYVSEGESPITGLFNLSTVLYVLQLKNQTNETITDQVGKLINSTWT